jgi:hypothetical protein
MLCHKVKMHAQAVQQPKISAVSPTSRLVQQPRRMLIRAQGEQVCQVASLFQQHTAVLQQHAVLTCTMHCRVHQMYVKPVALTSTKPLMGECWAQQHVDHQQARPAPGTALGSLAQMRLRSCLSYTGQRRVTIPDVIVVSCGVNRSSTARSVGYLYRHSADSTTCATALRWLLLLILWSSCST